VGSEMCIRDSAYTVKFVMMLQNKFRQRKEAKSGAGID